MASRELTVKQPFLTEAKIAIGTWQLTAEKVEAKQQVAVGEFSIHT